MKKPKFLVEIGPHEIAGITGKAASTQHEINFAYDRDPHFDAEFIFLVSFAFGNPFDFRGLKTVQLVFILGLLIQNPLGFLQRLFNGVG